VAGAAGKLVCFGFSAGVAIAADAGLKRRCLLLPADGVVEFPLGAIQIPVAGVHAVESALCDFRIDHWPSGSHAPLPPAGKHSRTGKRQANQENEDQHGYNRALLLQRQLDVDARGPRASVDPF
jgi:hypothetical protein